MTVEREEIVAALEARGLTVTPGRGAGPMELRVSRRGVEPFMDVMIKIKAGQPYMKLGGDVPLDADTADAVAAEIDCMVSRRPTSISNSA